MRIATAWFLSGTLILIGCSSSKKGNVVLDAAAPTSGCVVDDSKGGDSAIPLQPAAKPRDRSVRRAIRTSIPSRWARA